MFISPKMIFTTSIHTYQISQWFSKGFDLFQKSDSWSQDPAQSWGATNGDLFNTAKPLELISWVDKQTCQLSNSVDHSCLHHHLLFGFSQPLHFMPDHARGTYTTPPVCRCAHVYGRPVSFWSSRWDTTHQTGHIRLVKTLTSRWLNQRWDLHQL